MANELITGGFGRLSLEIWEAANGEDDDGENDCEIIN